MRENQKRSGNARHRPKTRLGLPDLDQATAALLGSLRSLESQRGYRHSINEFISWYCSEPRLSFNKTVVTRHRIHLESRQLPPGTINVRLAAVRRLAYEAADSELLSPELAAGIQRVKEAKKFGGQFDCVHPPGSGICRLESLRLTMAGRILTHPYSHTRGAVQGNPACLKPKASFRVFLDSSGWPSALSSCRLLLEAQCTSLFTFSDTCEPHSEEASVGHQR